MIRILHFSDVHIQESFTAIPARELVGKRLLAVGNLVLHRGKFFRDALPKLEALARFASEQAVDAVVCTGDYTALGTEAEYASARAAIEPFTRVKLGFVTVPGNHDLYLDDTVRDARFERHFGELQQSDLPEYAVDGAYPFVRLLGDSVAVVGVNSARPNPNPVQSSGCVPAAQLEALRRLLDDERLAHRQVLVMTHYGVLTRDGEPDAPRHGLTNADALLEICARERVVVVHGHLHWCYAHERTARRPWLFCAGSATYTGREGFWVYELDAGTLRAIPGRYAGAAYELDTERTLEIRWS